MTQPDPIQLQLDATGYVAGMGQASQATSGFDSSLRGVTGVLAAMPTLMSKAVSHTPLLAFAGISAGAAQTQAALTPLKATASVVGANFDIMGKGMQQLARQFPIGNEGARQLYGTLSNLGMASKGQEAQVVGLAKAYTMLGAATNTGPSVIAAGMTQLARVTNTGFNIDRVNKIGDSLTTVAAKSGASAEGILSFSKLIAPLATASGVGATKIMGISAAFSKLGDDGSIGANAFNKMMGDLNKSVRDGSPLLANYASIVGKTQSQFAALAKSDPTEAVTQITEAIASAGANGPRLLEQLGLEGTRTAGVLQRLSAGGGLRKSIQDATDSYGNNNTQKAANETFGTLTSASEKYAAVIGQVTESLGGPFLGALTQTVNFMSTALNGVLKVTDSGPVQGLLKVAAEIGIPALLGMKLLGGGIKAAFAGQIATSSPVRGFLGGMAEQAGAARGMDPRETIWGKLGGRHWLDVQEQVAATAHLPDDDPRKVTLGNNTMQKVAGGSYRLGNAIRGFIGGSPSEVGNTGLLRSLLGGGVGGLGAYMQMNAETARMVRMPFNEREMRPLTSKMGDAGAYFRANNTVISNRLAAGEMTQAEAAMARSSNFRGLVSDLGQLPLRQQMGILGSSFGSMAGQTAMTGASAALTGGKRLGSMLAGAFGGPIGLALMGGTLGLEAYHQSKAEDAQRAADQSNATSFIDDYRVAMGKATEATSTLAGAMGEASKSMVKSSLSTLDDIHSAAVAAGQKSRVQDYSGMSASAVRRQLQLETASGQLGPDELRRVQQDLFLSGFNKSQVGQATSGLNLQGMSLSGDLTKSLASTVTDQAHRAGEGGWRGVARGIEDFGAWVTGDKSERFTTDTLTKGTRDKANQTLKEMSTRAGARAAKYSPEYAAKQYSKEIDAAVSAAYKAGNDDLAQLYEKGYQNDLGLSNHDRIVNKQKIGAAGGSYTDALAQADKEYRQGTYQDVKAGTDQASLRQSFVATTLQGINNPLAALFDVNNQSAATKTVNNLVAPGGQAEDPKAQQAALAAVLTSQTTGAGQSMEQLAKNTLAAANSLGDLSDANATLLQAVLSSSRQINSLQQYGGSPGQQAQSQFRLNLDQAQLSPEGKLGQAEKAAGLAGLAQGQMSAMDQAKAIITNYREQTVQKARLQEDYNKQTLYSEQDYTRQLLRTNEQYGIQVQRTERNYNLQREYSIEDFHRNRLYAEQDFNKLLRRAAEDGARAMYEPYQRIQVQQTWDPANLLGNLSEQNQAIATQMKNLETIRQQGGSSNLIKLLGLNDPKNSQQLAAIIDDTARNPAVLASLNKAADDRMKLGGQLTMDKDNVGIGRQKEDFATSMARNDKTFAISLARAEAQQKQTLSDMAADQARTLRYMSQDRDTQIARATDAYSTMVNRMKDDIKRADETIVGDLGSLEGNLAKALNGQFIDFAATSDSTMKRALEVLRQYTPEVQALFAAAGGTPGAPPAGGPGAGGGLEGRGLGSPTGGHTPTKGQQVSMPGGYDYNAALKGDTRSLLYDIVGMSGFTGTVTSTNGGKHTGKNSYHYQNEAVDFDGGIDADEKLAEYLYNLNQEGKLHITELIYWNPSTERQFAINKGVNVDGNGFYGADIMREHRNHVHFALSAEDAKYAIEHWNGQQYSKQRNTAHADGGILTGPTVWRPGHLGGEAGHEAIIPLNNQGIQVLAEAMKRFVSPEQGRALKASGGVHYVTYDNSTTHYDNRTVIENVHLKAETPRQLVAEADKIRRRGALTAPPQRRTS